MYHIKKNQNFTFMQRMAACLTSWFSVDGPLNPDCSAPLNVNQLTKLNTADSPLTRSRGAEMNPGLLCEILFPYYKMIV